MDFTKPFYLIVVDLETMGKKPGCIVTEIGATVTCVGGPLRSPIEFAETIDYLASKKAGFKADKGTMDWWAEKLEIEHFGNRRVYEREFANRWRSVCSVKKSITHFVDFYNAVVELVGDEDQVLLVGNDIDFDKCILEHYFAATNTPIPWHYRAWISLPTLVWVTGILTGVNVKELVRETWQTQHTGIDDARQEAAMIQTALSKLFHMQETSDFNTCIETGE